MILQRRFIEDSSGDFRFIFLEDFKCVSLFIGLRIEIWIAHREREAFILSIDVERESVLRHVVRQTAARHDHLPALHEATCLSIV